MRGTSPTPSCSDGVTARLREQIFSGAAAPGALLAEAAVAQRLGVSRVPVREALFALERDGLVEFSPTGRAYVKGLTPRDFEELYTLRLALEPLAARLAAPVLRGDAEMLTRNIRATARAKTIADVTRLDLDFHEIILAASGHARLLKLWRSMRSELELWLGRLHRRHQGQNLDTRTATADSHRQIVEVFQTQAPATCESTVRKHITGWREWLPALEVES